MATVYAGSGDGFVRRSNSGAESWATLRNSTTGSSVGPTATADFGVAARADSYIYRSWYPFDLSSLPAGATVTAATLYVYVTAKASAGGGSTANNSVTVVEGTPASNTTLVVNDYDNLGSTEWVDSRTAFSSFTTSAYNAFTLNSAARTAASSAAGTGYFVVALRSGYDLDDVSPSPSTAISDIEVRYSDYASTTYDPYLVVNYSLARTTSDSWAWSDTAFRGHARETSDSWAWSDTAVKRAAPAARTMVGSPVKVFASNGVNGTFGAHYAFGFTVATGDAKLICFSVKASYHGASDAVVVSKTSSDDGATWGAEVAQPLIIKARASRSGTRIHGAIGYGTQPQYVYSDDNAVTWSTPVNISHGFYSNYVYTDDIIELANGHLLYSAYGFDDAAGVTAVAYKIRVSRSTDGGATWSALALVSGLVGGYAVVESQMEQIASTGDIFMTFHTQDALPTDFYRVRSQDGGATWGTPVVLVSGDSFNRQGLTSFSNDGVMVAFNQWAAGAAHVSYIESYDGTTFGSAVSVAAYQVGGASYAHPLFSQPIALGGEGLSQNVGFTYSTENLAQDLAEQYYVQFSGIDGTVVYRRATSDSWAWSDAAAQTHALGKTTSDSWAWSDAALGSHRSTADAWAWSDAATRTTINAKTTADTWAWSDVAAQTVPGSSKTTADTWAWSDTATRTAPKARTTTDTWLWTEPPEVNTPSPLFWLRARRRTMSAPTKTYVAVLPKGTTRTSSYTSPTYEAKTEAGILVVLDVTAASGTGGLTLRINAQDQASAQAVALNAAPTAVTAVGTTSYALYPFGAVAGNVTQATEFYLPRMFSITVTHGDSSSYTYSLGYCLLP